MRYTNGQGPVDGDTEAPHREDTRDGSQLSVDCKHKGSCSRVKQWFKKYFWEGKVQSISPNDDSILRLVTHNLLCKFKSQILEHTYVVDVTLDRYRSILQDNPLQTTTIEP